MDWASISRSNSFNLYLFWLFPWFALCCLVGRGSMKHDEFLEQITDYGGERRMINKHLIAILISVVWLFGTSAWASELENGFLHYSWGDSSSHYSGLNMLGQKGDVRYYSKPGESYTIGDVSIDKVIYGFYKDQLFGVYLNLENIDLYDKLLNHMKSLYGLPATKLTVDDQSVYKWKQQDITVKLKLDKPTQKMKLAYYYQPLSSQLNKKQWDELDTSSFRFVPIEKDKKPEKFVLFEF